MVEEYGLYILMVLKAQNLTLLDYQKMVKKWLIYQMIFRRGKLSKNQKKALIIKLYFREYNLK